MPTFALMVTALALALSTPAFAGAPIDTSHGASFSGDDDDPGDVGPITRGTVQKDDAKKSAKGAKTAPAPAIEDEPDDEPDEDLGLEDKGGSEDEDEPSLGDYESGPAKPAAKPAPIGPVKLDVAGKTPLADNYPVSVVAVDRDAVVVELPVLLAKSRVADDKGFQLIGEVWVGDTKVNEVREVVTPAGLAEFGPSFAFLKMTAPVVEKQGEVKIVVKRANADGSAPTELFSRVTAYALQ